MKSVDLPEVVTISYSLLSLFRNCRKKAYFKYMQGLIPLGPKPKALFFGSVVHSCLDKYYTTRDLNTTLSHLDSLYPDRTLEEVNEEYLTAKALLEGYISYYKDKDDFEVISLEKKFEAPIIDMDTIEPIPGVKMFGIVDGIVKKDGEYYLLEHKTASKVTGSYIDKLWSDFQISLYCYYVFKVFGFPCAGVYYNVIAKPDFKRDKGETSEDFKKRQAEAIKKNKSGKTNIARKVPETNEDFYLRLREFYNKPESFCRQDILIGKSQMKKVVFEISELTKSFLACIKRDRFYMNTDHCFSWGRPCEYFQICRSGDNQNIIDNFYEKKPRYSLNLVVEDFSEVL